MGNESQWGQDFLYPTRLALGPTQPPVQCVLVFQGKMQPGHGADHPHPSSTKVVNGLDLTSASSLCLL